VQLDASGCGSAGEKLDGNRRHFVPRAAFEEATVALFEDAAPLLEVESDTGFLALVADVGEPKQS
jgi:hypothetical protein